MRRPLLIGFLLLSSPAQAQEFSATVSPDFAHPLWFGIDDSPSPSSPAASPASAELAGRPAVRGRTVTVRLRCRSEAGSCRGVVGVRRGGRRVAARRFVIAPRAQKRLRLRLPRALGRSLRRRGRLSVQVVVDLDDAAPVARRVTLRRR